MLGGALQILASVALGLARVDALHAAANEGATRYVLAVLASSTGLALAWLVRKRPLAGWSLILAGFGLLVLLSIPAVSTGLLIQLQGIRPAAVEAEGAQAIVVLGADGNSFAPEFPGAGVGALTLERLRYTAVLAKQTGLPVLVSAGAVRAGERSLAEAMAATLDVEFGVPVRWREGKSGNTRQNAQLSAEVLRKDGIERVLVVTHAWHEPRAIAEFERAGLVARPAGTGWRQLHKGEAGTWIPSARGLRESAWALHEMLGRMWYAVGPG